MRLSLPTPIRSRSGLTLAELLVVTMVLSLLLTSLCGIYIAMIHEWQRQQGQGDALVALSRTLDVVTAEVSQAVTADTVVHGGPRGALVYTLPLDKDATNKYYVPKWVNGTLQYRPGPQKVFYLSDATGAWNHTGNILWRGVISGSYPFSYTVSPDPAWDADAQRGRISGIDSMQFDLDNWGHPKRVTITTNVTYKVMTSTTQMNRTAYICMRNAN